MRFFPSEAPKTVENFIELAESGYFDGQMISRIEKIDQEDRTKGRIVAGSGKPVAEEGKCIFLKKSWNRKFPIIWQPFQERSCPMLGWSGGQPVFYCGFPKVYQEELDEIRENNYPKQMVDLFEKEGGYPEEWLHQSVFAQVVEGYGCY